MKNYDYYEEASSLASLLTKDGEDKYATKLNEAIEQGCTGTEILMALKFNIEEILKLSSISEASKKKATNLYDKLVEVLQ